MCGVFGFVAKGDSTVNLKLLRPIAENTQRRGPHAWGMAWIDRAGVMHSYKQTGPIVDSLGLLAMAKDATMLIGHCRYATHGSPEDNTNNHPHATRGGYIVHNGVISHYRELISRFKLKPKTECDSEVLALMVEQFKGSALERAKKASMLAARSPFVMLGLFQPGRLVVCRAGNPLSVGETGKGFYLASLQAALPGVVQQVRDEQIFEFADENN